jgi:membrane peptidoglycan carboxypeptidase
MGYEVAVTPLQLVAAYSALANGGELLEPHLVKEIRSADGDLIYRSKPRIIRRVVSAQVARDVQQMLLGVVESGTGTRADLATYLLGGKSGTARRTVKGKGYVLGNYTASFVGLFPADRPQYVVLVKLDSPRHAYFGGEIAAPLAKFVLRAALAARDAALDRGMLASVERTRGWIGSVDTLAQPGDLAETPERPSTEAKAQGEETLALRATTTINLPWVARPKPIDRTVRQVPDVSGLTLRQAVRALHQAGFRVRVISQRDGVTDPVAGTPMAAGSVVKLNRNQ